MKWRLYRLIMRIAHRYNWHYAPPVYPNGDTHLWCQWCGFNQTVMVADHSVPLKTDTGTASERVLE